MLVKIRCSKCGKLYDPEEIKIHNPKPICKECVRKEE